MHSLMHSQATAWFPPLDGFTSSRVLGMSTDGRVAVGNSYRRVGIDYMDIRATRWVDGVPEFIPIPEQIWSRASDVSSDGRVVVGIVSLRQNDTVVERAFRWVEGQGVEILPPLDDSHESQGVSWGPRVSSDGRVVAGISGLRFPRSRYPDIRVYRWEVGAGIQDLGALSETVPHSIFHDISADGRVIVGTSAFVIGESSWGPLWEWRAFRWENGQIQQLEVFEDDRRHTSNARAVSPDGRTAVGDVREFLSERDFAVAWRDGRLEHTLDLGDHASETVWDISSNGRALMSASYYSGSDYFFG